MNARDPLIGHVLEGRYEIQSLLSTGGMGKIYIAEQQSTKQQVALKCILDQYAHDDQFMARFRREAMIISKLKSPHTLRLLDQGALPSGGLFMVCELLEGQPLDEVIRAEGRLSAPRTLNIMQQVLRSLAEAHRHGVIHRDLKPNNLFVTNHDGEEHVTVLDFGIAKWKAESTPLTRTGAPSPGTLEYMSPEQIKGLPCDPQADLYALGVVAFECLTGKRPFQGVPFYLKHQHLNEPPPTFNAFCDAHRLQSVDVPADLEQLIHWCLEKDPVQRPESAAALRKEATDIYHRLVLNTPASDINEVRRTGELAQQALGIATTASSQLADEPKAHNTVVPSPPSQPVAAPVDSATTRILPPEQPAPAPAVAFKDAGPQYLKPWALALGAVLTIGGLASLTLVDWATPYNEQGISTGADLTRQSTPSKSEPRGPTALASHSTESQPEQPGARPKHVVPDSNRPVSPMAEQSAPEPAARLPSKTAEAVISATEMQPLVEGGTPARPRTKPKKGQKTKSASKAPRRASVREEISENTTSVTTPTPSQSKINLNLGQVGKLKGSDSESRGETQGKKPLININDLGTVKQPAP